MCSSVSLSHPLQKIMSIPLDTQIKQSQANLDKLQAELDEEKASVFEASKKYERGARSDKATKQFLSEGAHLALRMKALGERYRTVIDAQKAHLALQRQALHGKLERQHGLLSYAIANGGVSTELQLLHSCLSDYLNAKTDSDKKAAKRSIDLCWEHSTLPEVGAKALDTDTLDTYEALEGADATFYYKQNQEAILAQMEASRNSQNNIN